MEPAFLQIWLIKAKKGLFTNIIHRQTDLQTAKILPFQLALSDLVKKLSEDIPGYSQRGYKIIFNLTGGFKSVQGFLQSIANFYADESVYIFEKSSELLRIPKLPIRMDALSIVSERIIEFRKLSLGIAFAAKSLKDIPETLLLELDGKVVLSSWGEIIWEQSKGDVYKKELLCPPIDRIKYTGKFEKDVSDLEEDRVLLVNKRIDQLAKYLMGGGNPNSLDFKQLKGNKKLPSTHEIDAWSDRDAKRIFGHYEEESVFVLDGLAKGLH